MKLNIPETPPVVWPTWFTGGAIKDKIKFTNYKSGRILYKKQMFLAYWTSRTCYKKDAF